MNTYKTQGVINAIVGGSGSGKTTSYMIPNILKAIDNNKSFVVTDAKNEVRNYIGNSLSEHGYKVIDLNFRDLTNTYSWNPLFLPYKAFSKNEIDNCYFLLNCIAQSLFNQGKESESDPYWILTSRDLFIGLAFALFEDATQKDQINLCSIYSMAMSAHERIGSNSYLNEYIEMKKDKQSYAVSCTYGTVKAPVETRSSILSVFHQKMRMLTMNDRYNAILCNESIDISALLKEKVAFIIQYEDEIDESFFLTNIFISQLLNLLINERAKGDRGYQEFYFFFEDFLLLNYFPNLAKMIMTCKSRKINLFFSINDLHIMESIYGDKITNALLDNCDKLVFTECRSRATIEYLKMLYNDISFIYDINPDESIVINNHNTHEVSQKEFANSQGNKNKTLGVRNVEKRPISIFSVKEVVDRNMRESRDDIFEHSFGKKDSIDEIIKKIDQKIAELEEEESEQKEGEK